MTTSAAMARYQPDRHNPWFTRFRYQLIDGLGYERGIVRRDPSCIIQVDGTYFVWYTRGAHTTVPVGHDHATETLPAVAWDLCDVWYATSSDGHSWQEQGPAVNRGPAGSYDERSVFTPDVLAHDGRYYLVYQVTTSPSYRCTPESIAIAWADSPHGPWNKSPAPVVEPDPSGEVDERAHPEQATAQGSFDSLRVHDPALLFREGRYWLYFKGEGIGHSNMESKWGVAIADNPLGPYSKSPLNPVTNSGHEVMVWEYAGGVGALLTRCGPEKNTIQFAPDGIDFQPMATIIAPPQATGALRVPDSEGSEPLTGLSWGLSHVTTYSAHLSWQGRDPLGLSKIDEPWDFIIRWEREGLPKGKDGHDA
ncbi:MAG: family 43 glycosylhydrolase [Chloroflexi bacterium]|nr:family 43 glycosylhydrolase [Chloroflexota bacterium]